MKTVHTGVHIGGPIDGQRKQYPDDRHYAEYAKIEPAEVQPFSEDMAAAVSYETVAYEKERFRTGEDTEFTIWRESSMNLHVTMLTMLQHYKPPETDPVKIKQAEIREKFIGDDPTMDLVMAMNVRAGMTMGDIIGLLGAATDMLGGYGVTATMIKEHRKRMRRE
jgi:hypothetical protein